MSRAQELNKMRKENESHNEIKHFDTIDCSMTIDSYYKNILPIKEIESAVEKYNLEFDEISEEFSKRTSLSKIDCAFLVLAIALQCARQYFMTNFKDTIDEDSTKKEDKEKFTEKTDKLGPGNDEESKKGGYYFAKFENICADTSVPYDIINGSKKFDIGLGGKTHRYKTIGHDPLLGYIFGTMNILTNTLTSWDFKSFHIRKKLVYSNAITVRALDSMVSRIQSDPASVAAALIKQTIHIKSDMYTPNRIPFPGLSEVSPELSMKLAKYGINYSNALTVGKQATISISINMIIRMLHRLLMENDDETDEKIYEVRTRKILLYSNLIATSSNVIYCGLSNDYKKMDIGGFAVTMYRLFSDTKFIDKVKYEFINSNLSSKYEEEYEKIEMYYSK